MLPIGFQQPRRSSGVIEANDSQLRRSQADDGTGKVSGTRTGNGQVRRMNEIIREERMAGQAEYSEGQPQQLV
ncbi:MAG: hypothetical protein MPJ50_10665 [Pirellulales bacterium]|nr:hypothetical protein [Pirellulales bacterium]